MIRLRCPNCRKTLGVADHQAGVVGNCPHCKSKVRVPSLEAIATDVLEEAPPEDSASDQVRPSLPAKRRRVVEEEDWEVIEDVEPEELPRPRSIRRRVDDEEDDRPARRSRARDDDDDDEPPRSRRPRRRRRRSSSSSSGGMSGGLLTALIIGGICLLFSLGAIVFPPLGYLPVTLGGLTSVAGGIMFLHVAFKDDAMQGLLCWFVPFYNLYYLITHFDEEKVPFFMQVGGGLIMMFGSCGMGIGAARWGN
jgi:phage FluMu protein Com